MSLLVNSSYPTPMVFLGIILGLDFHHALPQGPLSTEPLRLIPVLYLCLYFVSLINAYTHGNRSINFNIRFEGFFSH